MQIWQPGPIQWLILLGSSWAMCGIIWLVQLVHYPTFRFLGADHFLDFHRHHTETISVIVAPLMLIELVQSSWLVWRSGLAWPWLIVLVLVLLLWVHTFWLAVPLHRLLGAGYSEDTALRLVGTNWWRTLLWTLKAGWVSVLFYNFCNRTTVL